MSKLILGSASPRRKEIMELMGLQFIVRPSHCEEVITETDPEKIVMELSRQKAEDVAGTAESGDIIIGSDTIVALDGQILGKPRDRDHAFSMLRAMAGNTHHVYTGVTILRCPELPTDKSVAAGAGGTDKRITFAECTEVHVASMTDEEINDYLDIGEYKDKAGAYGIQGRFAPHITGINGDFYNVMGLPAAALYRHLKEFTGELG